jgi:hypothetical protein
VRAPSTVRRVLVALAAAAAVVIGSACTPEEFQAWWVAQGNAPLPEPELSRRAADATAYWAEMARRDRFVHASSPITPDLARRITPTSWRAGCPVPLSSLRYLHLSHMGFDGSERRGELIVHADVAGRVIMAFKLMWDAGFPIERMRLVDDYGGDDERSMAANNTSGFNCRRVAGTSSWSEHAYGRAIDLNPVQNPYVSGSVVAPSAGRAYLDRSNVRPGMVVRGGPALDAFSRIGWRWGGDWRTAKDYQHVSSTGR